MKAKYINTHLVEWTCPNCDRGNVVSIKLLRGRVKGSVMECVGKNFSVSGDKPCHATVTHGEVLSALDGTPYTRIPEHTQLPVSDR